MRVRIDEIAKGKSSSTGQPIQKGSKDGRRLAFKVTVLDRSNSSPINLDFGGATSSDGKGISGSYELWFNTQVAEKIRADLENARKEGLSLVMDFECETVFKSEVYYSTSQNAESKRAFQTIILKPDTHYRRVFSTIAGESRNGEQLQQKQSSVEHREPFSPRCTCGGVWLLITPPTVRTAFYSCSNWPECNRIDIDCECGGKLNIADENSVKCSACKKIIKQLPRSRPLDSHGLGLVKPLNRAPLSTTCRCGGKWRTRISIAGRQAFYGCSEFPKCKLRDTDCGCGGVLASKRGKYGDFWQCSGSTHGCSNTSVRPGSRTWVSPWMWSANQREPLSKECWCADGGSFEYHKIRLRFEDYQNKAVNEKQLNESGLQGKNDVRGGIDAIWFQHGRGDAHLFSLTIDECVRRIIERHRKGKGENYSDYSSESLLGVADERYVGGTERTETVRWLEEFRFENAELDSAAAREYVINALGPPDTWNALEDVWAEENGFYGTTHVGFHNSYLSSTRYLNEWPKPDRYVKCSAPGCNEFTLDTPQLQFREHDRYECTNGHVDYLCSCGGEFIWVEFSYSNRGEQVSKSFMSCTSYPECKEVRRPPKIKILTNNSVPEFKTIWSTLESIGHERVRSELGRH
jgi:ssDNA-binding Zn-finger/Zn-ribbon topoisomerase 1